MEKSLFAILLGGVLLNNYALTSFLGVPTFLGASKDTKKATVMGIAVTVLTVLDELDVKSAMIMLGIGLACVGISLMNGKK